MIDGPVLTIVVGAAAQVIPPAWALLIQFRRRPRAAPTLGVPARI